MNCNSSQSRFPLFDELDRGLNHLVNEVLQKAPSKRDTPALSMYEFEDRYVVECDLPGVTLDEIDLQINDGVLELSGTRQNPYSDDTKVTVNERVFENFNRKLQLGKHLKIDAVDAELGNGVLKVTIPKADSVLPRSINIRSADA